MYSYIYPLKIYVPKELCVRVKDGFLKAPPDGYPQDAQPRYRPRAPCVSIFRCRVCFYRTEMSEWYLMCAIFAHIGHGPLNLKPQKAIRGGIPSPVLEPCPRSWSHFVANCCQKLTNLVKIDFEIPPRRALRGKATA